MPTYEELKKHADSEWAAILKPTTVQIFVGTATCGRAAGGERTVRALKAELSKRGISGTVRDAGCNGLCFAEPIVDVIMPGKPRISYGKITADKVPQFVEDVIVKGNPRPDIALGVVGEGTVPGIGNVADRPEMKIQVRAALRNAGIIEPWSVNQYIARGGYAGLTKAFSMKPEQAIDEVVKSGLRGRGGAAFPTGTKWKFIAGSNAPVKYHLCNAEEGDPGAFNDKAILESDPHSVVEGITIAGYASKASKGYIFIRCVHHEVISRVEKAIEEAKKVGLLGKNILGSGFDYDVEVAQTGESYVAGEETALMEAIEGKRSMPRAKPPFPATFGLWGKPSNINNVKTYAYVPEILANGGDWFAKIGSEKSKGTAIVCLSGDIKQPGTYEVPMGVTVRQVLETCGGGVIGKEIKVLQTGGPLGGLLAGNELDVKIDFDDMAAKGAILGSGGIIVCNENTCIVELTKLLADFNRDESCGKCFPCRIGTTHVFQILNNITSGKGKTGDVEKMLQIGDAMVSSLCGHGQLAGNPTKGALKYFKEEIEEHIHQKKCRTGRCVGLAATEPAATGANR
ncbi:MAG: NADH-quinone oxidoreductase subunit F [Dehalococcoidia bacterium]|nr:NADH-quinone oxidoreductase subunit F [Dehalococcoidia bacterium]